MTFDQFFEYAKAWAHADGRQFTEPDDDWLMRIVVDFYDEPPQSFQVPPWAMHDHDARSLLGRALAHATRLVKPTKVGLIQSSWMIDYAKAPHAPKVVEPGFVAPSQSPHRFEAVFLFIMDQEVERAAYARIRRRRRRPPVLSHWLPVPRDAQATGHLSDPLREALR
jgi:hypothetical protein